MADAAARNLQYEYKANSNLVLQADTRLIEKRSRDEATGEVVSLAGKLIGKGMGDKALRTKPPKANSNGDAFPPSKKSKRSTRDDHERKFVESKSVLSGGSEIDASLAAEKLYKPKTTETRQTYEVLLSFIQEALGDQPRDILHGAADEVLRTLKDDRRKDKEKKVETEELLGSKLAEERFALLVNLGKKITDFGANLGDEDEEENIDEAYGINVQFQESEDVIDDDEDERPRGYGAEVDSDDNDDDEEEEENEEEGEIEKSNDKKKSALKTDGLDSQKEKSKRLHPLDIDAHWLQRKLAQYYDDATTSQQKSKEVLKILRDSENN